MHNLATAEPAPVDTDQWRTMPAVLCDPSETPDQSAFSGLHPQPFGAIKATDTAALATGHGGAAADQSAQAPMAFPRRLRVVIVEDEAIVAMELEMLLEDLGAEVVGLATTAVDACALVQRHRPDFVTMDISIKGDRDGVSAAQEIFDSHGVRSIFISSNSDPVTQKRAETCQAIAWIKKPIDTADLTAALRLVTPRSH